MSNSPIITGVNRGETIRTNGRFPAFAGLARRTGGFYVEDLDEPMTVDAAISAAGLDYHVSVSESPVSFPVITENGVTTVTHPKFHGVYGRNPGHDVPFALGVVGKVFHPFQNREAFAFGETLIGEGARVSAAGRWGDPVGSKTYMAFKLPEGMTVGGEDQVDLYAHVVNGHDGGTGLTASIGPIQLSCTNQLPSIFGKFANKITLRHTSGIRSRVDEAHQVLGLARQYVEAFTPIAEELLATPMSDAEFVGFMDTLWAAPKADAGARTVGGYERKRDALQALWTNGTNPVGRGTRWGALNAVTEYADWFAPVRGAVADPSRRYERTADGAGESFKAAALRELIPA